MLAGFLRKQACKEYKGDLRRKVICCKKIEMLWGVSGEMTFDLGQGEHWRLLRNNGGSNLSIEIEE